MPTDPPSPPELLELATIEQRLAMWNAYRVQLGAWEQRRAADIVRLVIAEGAPGWQDAVVRVLEAGMVRVSAAQALPMPQGAVGLSWAMGAA